MVSMDRVPVLRLPARRLTLLGTYAVVVLVQLLQTPGRTTFDTKLDLLVNPGRFLSQSLTLWSPQLGMGEVQNQAYGYLFPLGPVFWLGHAAALPAWLTERLWSTALTLIAFEGARRLALAWGGLGWRGALLVGAAYVAAPRFLTTIGTLTGEALPTAMLPWAVLPLVLARRGRLGWLAGVVLSGAAVLFMGGQNAVETLAVLPLPAIVLALAAWRGELPRRSLAVWVAAVVAACSWWLGPLLLLGRYSPPFLDHIESAANTTAQLGWVNSLRGADHWVAYVTVGGRPWWPAGYSLAAAPWLVVATAVVAALSLAGLVGKRVPDRACLAVPLVLGLVCLVAPHGGWSGGLLATELRSWLDGPLAPLRNVHKVDPLVRLPLALGFGYLAHDARVALVGLIGRVPRWAARSGTAASVVASCCAVVVLAAAAQPAAAGELRQLPGWSAIPTAWHQAARAVDALPVGSRVLVVPATGFGRQIWGNTVDEPLQALTEGHWVSRGQAPLVPGGNVRLLDSIDRVLASGRGSVGLAPLLARSGITHVLLRTDLDVQASDAPSPEVVKATLRSSLGMTHVADFGVPAGASLPLQMWGVETTSADDPRVSLAPVSDSRVVQGGPEALLPLLADGALREDEPVLLAGQSPPWHGPVDILTDSLQRREQAFGRVHEAASSLMTAAEQFRTVRAAHHYEAFAGERQTVARYPALLSVSASSSGGYVDILGAIHPEEGPYSALDSDGSTAWVSAPFTDPLAQSLSVRMRSPAPLGPIDVLLWSGGGESIVTAVRVTTDAGSVTVPVEPGADSVTVTPPVGVTRSVRFEVAGVEPGSGTRRVGLADVHLPGVDTSRTLVVPGAAGPATTIAFGSSSPVRACTFPQRVCDVNRQRPAEESSALDRAFRVVSGGRWRLSLSAVARPSNATIQLLAPVAPGYRITASSVLGDDPVVAPTFALDGDPLTSWVGAASEQAPRLSLTWPSDRTLTRIQVGLGTQDRVRRPTLVRIRSGPERRVVTVGPGSFGFFAPLRTHHITLQFLTGRRLNPGEFRLPMEISELTIGGLRGIRYAPSPMSSTGQPCGFGPPVFVDGVRHETRVTGTLGDVLTGAPMSVSLCGDRLLTLPAGPNRIRIASTAQFQPVRAVLEPAAAAAAVVSPLAARQVRVTSWGASDRSVAVTGGAASILWVRENVNAGWVATTADGRELDPIVVDGWAQGWRVPAGGPGVVTLTFTPQGTYAGALLGGGALALLLMGSALFVVVRRRPSQPDAAGRVMSLDGRAVRGTALVCLAVAAALAGIGLLAGACAGMLPWLRAVWLRRALVVIAVVLAAWAHLVSGGDALGADLVAALAVGLAVGPDLSGRERPGEQRSRP